MREKNGFIATSLLYSFFLVFCALLMALVTTFVHNQLLLSNLTSGIKEDLSFAGSKTAVGLSIGDYVKMPLFSNERAINLQDTLWIVSSVNEDNTISLVSSKSVFKTEKYSSLSEMQEELNLYYSFYTTGGSINAPHVTYITRSDILKFKVEPDDTTRSALVDEDNEYLYYEDKIANPGFRIRKKCTSSSCYEFNNVLTPPKQYPIRLLATVSKTAPVQGGRGQYLDPYIFSSPVYSDNSLKLHYNYLNVSGNKGIKSSGINMITDLSGENIKGIFSANATLALEEGIALENTNIITTNFNLFDLLKNNSYTIEFCTKGDFVLSSPRELEGLIKTSLNSAKKELTISIGFSSRVYTENIEEFNTIAFVREYGYMRLYINGSSYGHDFTLPVNVMDTNLFVGDNQNNIKTFKSIRIYNRALTPEEVRNNALLDRRWS